MGKSGIATRLSLIITVMLISACTVGPNYVAPAVIVPPQYKEGGPTPKGWKVATPRDEQSRGCWWEVFNNDELNALEARLNISNQNIAAIVAQYQQSLALVDEAQAAAYPIVGGFISATRQKPPASSFSNSSGTGTGGLTPTTAKSLPPFSTYIINFNASWEPDLWGSVRRTVEAASDTAQATAAQLAAVRLSSEELLAQDYFQLRTLDALQKLLNDIVKADQQLLTLTQGRYHAGTASLADVAQAEATLQAAQAAAINNGVSRAQFEHAIAVLVGEPPSTFTLKPKILVMRLPNVPAQVPSQLLERRPDIAEAERQVAAANAQIGVAIANFYPTLPLTASTGFQSNHFASWLSGPSSFWLLGAELMDTILDGGLRSATVAAARATYDQTVANYRQTVLSAFQNVEDGLSTQRILRAQEVVQRQAVATAKLSLRLQLADFKAGTTDLTSVLVAQNTTFTIEQNEVTTIGQQMIAAAALIAALGGGWDDAWTLSQPPKPS